ncbi:MAG: NAD(+) kinase [Gammaproteobacteria bacterium]
MFETIGLIGKFGDPGSASEVDAVRQHLLRRGRTVHLDRETANYLAASDGPVLDYESMADCCDLVIVVGGDGTLLHAARKLADTDVPVLGVNLGRLGFLVDVSPSEAGARLDEILDGQFIEEPRALLAAEVRRGNEILLAGSALNDVALHKAEIARIIGFDTYVDGKFVNRHRADGLVVATPTGSTAYALSGGGPLIYPTLDTVVMVPICPHTLSDRPIVVSMDSEIRVRLNDPQRPEARITLDGQCNFLMGYDDIVHIRRHRVPLRLIHPADYDYFEILRAKLHWGSAPEPRR